MSTQPGPLEDIAEWLSGVLGLGYNIVHEGGRPVLIPIFFVAF